MKKIYLYLLAAASVFAVASCQQAEMEVLQPVNPEETTTLTLAFDATRTALVDGKTAWVAGDKVRIYNSTGTFYNDITISEADAGKASIDVEVQMKDKEYFAVYPVEAANGISSGKIGIKIPSNPDGLFASANICVAQTGEGGTTLRMRNATAILKLKVNSGNVVEILQFSAQNPMVGTYTVDLSGDAPALTAVSGTKSATVAVGGVDGDYYIPVAPGTYAENFTATALRGNGGYQTLTSTKANEIALNTIVDMGSIGSNLSTGLTGEGTEGNPYVISGYAEYVAFTASVNLGNPYEGKFVSLSSDLEDVKTPVGYYEAADEQASFKGTFLGNNHTVALNLDGDNNKNKNYIAAFGLLGEGAVVKDVKVSGTAVTTGNYSAGLVAYAKGTSDARVTINNCESVAKIDGTNQVSGIAGYACYTDITNCKNSGALTGKTNVAGILGYAYYANIKDCSNSGAITGTADCGRVLIVTQKSHNMCYLDGSNTASYGTISTTAIGGISGWTQNSTVENCSNSGTVSGVSKVAGIAGALFWSTSKKSVNTASVTASNDFAGGIVGWCYTNTNNYDDTDSGTVTGRAAVGGIAGMLNAGMSNGIITVRGCKNTGEVISTGTVNTSFYQYGFSKTSAAGGIAGLAEEYYNGAGNRCVQMTSCVNEGAVSGPGQAVGGIVGIRVVPLNNCQKGYIDKCINKGSVESKLYRAGGIAGVCFDRFENSGFIIRNCENHGTIKAPYVLAGIVGFATSAYPAGQVSDAATIRILNCYNDGDILYDATAYEDAKGPYAAGIVGYNQKIRIYNVFNAGAVKPVTGEANEYDAKLRAEIVSCLGRYAIFNYLYSKKTGLPIATDTPANTPAGVVGDVTGQVQADGYLENAVIIAGKDYDTPVAALNAWITSVTTTPNDFLTWKAGTNSPEFDK